MLNKYSEAEIQEALDELVANGDVIQKGDRYYAPDHLKDHKCTTPEQGNALEEMLSAFDLISGDFVSMAVLSDGIEVRVSRVDQ